MPSAPTNPLADYFFGNPDRLIHKWHHYFEIYHRHFERFRGQSPVVVEVGVFQGGSLQMWHEYFGAGTRVVGIDIDPRCKQFEDASTTILIGDQADRGFLAEVRKAVPRIDILIDDGGHTPAQQIATLEELYLHIQPNGVYVCEDLHTSFMPEYGGGYLRPGTFLEYAKGLVDNFYGWYSREQERLAVNQFTVSTFGAHFYDSVLVLEKRPVGQPKVSMTGKPSF
ncbi:MAG TPA: class I SAM-dependent methyltransferase [Burkholderiales bacterium]|nr:class I SAM-dependent methyltransferase [Burkholderiales bacterium]